MSVNDPRPSASVARTALASVVLVSGLALAPGAPAHAEESTHLVGTVRTVDGRPAAGARIDVDAPGGWVTTRADRAGRYSVDAVSPSRVIADLETYVWQTKVGAVTPAPGATVRRDLVMKSGLDTRVRARVGHEKATLVIRLRPYASTVRNTGTMTLRWKKPNGKPATKTRRVDGQTKVSVHLPRIKSGHRAVTVVYRSKVVASQRLRPAFDVR